MDSKGRRYRRPEFVIANSLLIWATLTLFAVISVTCFGEESLSLDLAEPPVTSAIATVPCLEGGPACMDTEPWAAPVRLTAGYDRGFFIASDDPSSNPFVLKANFQAQFRYTGFSPTQAEWTDSSGNTLPIADRNDFDINRGRIIFSGTAIDPDLQYYINLDYSTLGDDNLGILLARWNYRFNPAFDFYVGKGKVPGGREWLLSAMHTMSPDRSLATTLLVILVAARKLAQDSIASFAGPRTGDLART